MLPITQELIGDLRNYYKKWRPHRFLFKGQGSHKEQPKRYSASSLRKIFNRACADAGINKHVKLHGLRHAFATFIGAWNRSKIYSNSFRTVSSKTTEIYTHVSKTKLSGIPTPIDFCDFHHMGATRHTTTSRINMVDSYHREPSDTLGAIVCEQTTQNPICDSIIL